MQIHKTPEGIAFGALFPKPATPAPTLFIFAAGIEETLSDTHYSEVGQLLSEFGVCSVGISLPCHGENHTTGDEKGLQRGLSGWRQLIDNETNPMQLFTTRARSVLDYLISEGFTDPQKIAACGTSRGGFSAMHFACAEPRIKCVAAFSPVADVRDLSEFAGLDDDPIAVEIDLRRHAETLASRALWITIGNNDARVNTDSIVDVARRVAAFPPDGTKFADVSLKVLPSEGHSVPAGAHPEAASWLRDHLNL